MVVTDPIADMLTRMRNAITVRHETVDIPASKMKVEMAKILKGEGFIADYDLIDSGTKNASVRVYLHYRSKADSAITGLKRVSKPGLRVYVQKKEIPRYYGGMGVSILSTSEGIMTGKQAWRKGLGGELLCYVW